MKIREERRYTVLIVEDEQIVRETLAADPLFDTLGLSVIASGENGIEGEQLIREMDPDIVITDIRLPGQDGLSMLEKSGTHHAIVLSGHVDFSYMRKAIQLGVVDYLRKPLDEEELEATLSALIEKLRNEDEDLASLTIDTLSSHEILIPSQVHHHLVDAAITYIREHYREPMGLQETCEAVGVSESHLSRVFKETTGINFLGYLNAHRINMALRLLDDPRNNITAVATLSGFPNAGYFTKLFKRYYELTPSQFRDQVLSGSGSSPPAGGST